MDTISQTIINAVNKVKNAVVKISKLKKKDKKPSGVGSGFVFSSDGYVFSNHHVIDGAEKINITLLDGKELEATLIGSDADTDISILKVYEPGFTVAKLGNSDELEIGQFLIAIGNPYGFQHTVTAGVLSGMARTMTAPSGRQIENVLQTDIALNPGNSGGPLINTDGEVVGINTAVIPYANGISFSVDIETAKEAAKYIIRDGKVKRAYLGVMLQDVSINPRIRNFHKLETDKGTRIIGVENSSPAQRAALQEGDIIIEFDGNSITSSGQLYKLLKPDTVFNSYKIKVLRQTKLKELDIFLVERPAA
jgi:S1-C subfamily serine protease